MADITMCPGANLPQCDTCYRKLAKESPRQSWFVNPPNEDANCVFYWKVEMIKDESPKR